MKPRRIVIQIEMGTDVSIKQLKDTLRGILLGYGRIIQIQANVIKKEK